ncbi:MAG: acyltransferase [Lachnospiraceae bacterium]|nr:acyltransferase [Lachnospiraceae bacterium]
MERKRLIGLDVFRILSALMVYLFHTFVHMRYYYGALHSFIRMGAVFMTAFFMLSGFSLYISNRQNNLMQLDEMKQFYLKRFMGVMPVYYVVAILYIIFLGKESLLDNLVLAPVEVMGLQATLGELFPYSHNTGTWFISCLVIFYLLYPFMQEVLKQLSFRAKMTLILLCYFILAWFAIVVWKLKLEYIYTNPFFRGIEFLSGAVLAAGIEELQKIKFCQWFMKWRIFLAEMLILILVVTAAVELDFAVGNYMTYDMFCFPIFIIILFTLSGVESKRLASSKLLRYLSSISYVFFLAQFFTWDLSGWIIKSFAVDNNYLKMGISFGICMLFTILLHEFVEKPIRRLSGKFLKKKEA